jgi:hypothetical protein
MEASPAPIEAAGDRKAASNARLLRDPACSRYRHPHTRTPCKQGVPGSTPGSGSIKAPLTRGFILDCTGPRRGGGKSSGKRWPASAARPARERYAGGA